MIVMTAPKDHFLYWLKDIETEAIESTLTQKTGEPLFSSMEPAVVVIAMMMTAVG
jgi:hypothetical protein